MVDTYTQTSSGLLSVQIDGPGDGQFGQLAVGGMATLDGTLQVRLGTSGYIPAIGQQFQITTYGSHQGAFSTFDGATITDINNQPVAAASNRTFGLAYGTNTLNVVTLAGAPRSYQAPTPQPNLSPQYVPHLAQWDSMTQTFVPVENNSITGGNVHVLVHGWAPGYKDDVELFKSAYGTAPDVWDPRFQLIENSEGSGVFASWYTDLAEAIEYRYANTSNHGNDEVHILAFSWIDESATDNLITAYQSQSHTSEQGGELELALLKAIQTNQFDGELQILGHSHGSKVAATAAQMLDGLSGNPLHVSNLILFDSPENIVADIDIASNNLGNVLTKINTGTIIINFFSHFGQSYDLPNIANVELRTEHLDSISDKHGYPVDWYERALKLEDVAWFGGLLNSPLSANNYFQDWIEGDSDAGLTFVVPEREFVLTEGTAAKVRPIQKETNLSSFFYSDSLEPFESSSLHGIKFEEHSPVYYDASFLVEEGDLYLAFLYQFLDVGDGDQLGIWIDDELRFLVTGTTMGLNLQAGTIDVTNLELGVHFITIALHNVGDANAQFVIGDFQTVAIPEPGSILLISFCFCVIVRINQTANRRRE